jgi:hypothetical protein
MGPGRARALPKLRLIVTTEGGLEQIRVSVRPAHAANLDPIVEAFEGMRLRAVEDRAFGFSGPLEFDYVSLGHQHCIFLGPQPTQEDLRLILFSLANVTM